MASNNQMIHLDQVRVGSPCPTSWKEMEGDDQVRYCTLCKLNVYNLSSMSREDAEHLVNTHEGRLCVRFVQRPDGKIMTKHCPKGEIVRGRRKFAFVLVSVAAFLVAGVASVFTPRAQKESWYQSTKEKARAIEPFRTILDKVDPEPRATVGAMVCAPPSKGP